MLKAVIFDFDGLLLDTEWPGYLSWRALYAEHGFDLPLTAWADYVGTAAGTSADGAAAVLDPGARLAERLVARGASVDLAALRAERSRRREAIIRTYPPMPGAVEAVEACRARGLRLAIASSSPSVRVRDHLAYLATRGADLASRFEAIICRDQAGDRPKPDPAVYQAALRALAVAPTEALAVEDSLHGVAAAQAAGLFTVAVPNRSTAGLDFGAADIVLASLEEFDVERLIREFAPC